MSEESALWYSSLDGLSLFARRFGTGSRRGALLCLHDVARTSRSLVPLAQGIASQRRVLIPDLRGHGRSDYPFDLKSYSVKALAEDAAALLATEEIAEAIVLGCGLGGIIALQLAVQHSQSILGVVLCECSPELTPQAIEETALRTELAASLGSWARAEQALHGARLILRDDEGRPSEDWDPAAAPSLALSLASMKSLPLFEQVRGKPVLALRGASSPNVSAEACEAMARCNSDLKCVNIAGISDARRFDQPEILKPIKAFLARFA